MSYNVYDAIKDLMLLDPFYGNLSIQLDKYMTESVDTACVSLKKDKMNIDLLVSPKYWDKLSNNLRLGLIKHEMLHVAFFHLFLVPGYEDKKLFNIAADLCVNQYIDANQVGDNWITFKSFPDISFKPKESTDYYYNVLEQNKNNPTVKSLLDHLNAGKPAVCSHKGWEGIQDVPEEMRELAKKQLEYQMKDIFDNILNKNRGLLPGHLAGLIDSFGKIQPPILDWKQAIRRFATGSNKIKFKLNKNKLNKRYEGCDFPGSIIKRKRKLLVAIDTSGSVSGEELKQFLTQIHHIWRTDTEIDIIQCDAKIQNIAKYTGKTVDFKIFGRGGTAFDPPVQYLNENNYNGLIYFTDGAGSCSVKTLKPILWVISGRNPSHYGVSQYIDQLPGKKVFIEK
jgi:predicted metal-dependent peptidase